MELARAANGQATIPTLMALEKIRNDFAGEAERLGLQTEQDIVDLVKAVRREVWEEKHASNG